MPKEILHTMGKRLKMLRDNAEMDQRQFAHAVSRRGVSVTNSFVSKMESGDSKPSIDVLVAMADELDVSADYLLKHPLYSTLPGPVRPVFVAQLFDYYSNCLLTALTDCARMDSEANELRKRKRPTPL